MFTQDRTAHSSVNSHFSVRTIDDDLNNMDESFPFDDDPEFLSLPETEKEIQRQGYRNT